MTKRADTSSSCINGGARTAVDLGRLVFAGELLMRQPGIVALHAVTTSNATRYAFQTQRERRDPSAAAAAERRVSADVPRCDCRRAVT